MATTGYKYKIDLVANCIFVKHYGSITFDSLRERSNDAGAHPDHRPGLNRVLDLTGCSIEIDPAGIRAVAGYIKEQSALRGTYTEILIVDSALAFGFGRVISGLLDENFVRYLIFYADAPNLGVEVKKALSLNDEYLLPEFLIIQ
ncbi:hypothetical protein [Sneathiella aquimaris]|uniref:hypothetical protein n=1 Tax=Sneathiella aquimaris TaxID=2599305 RepID=UPI00146BA335|nr:hypothetical protein [Sneathiella aquimaris]